MSSFKFESTASALRGLFFLIHSAMEPLNDPIIPKPEIRVDGEHDTQTGWLFTMTVIWEGDGAAIERDHELTMAWVDHEHLVGGAKSPSLVAMRAMELACDRFGRDELPARCDVSSLRRLILGFDQAIRSGQAG